MSTCGRRSSQQLSLSGGKVLKPTLRKQVAPKAKRAQTAEARCARMPCADESLVGQWCWVWWGGDKQWYAAEITKFDPTVMVGKGQARRPAPHWVYYVYEPEHSHFHEGPDLSKRELVMIERREEQKTPAYKGVNRKHKAVTKAATAMKRAAEMVVASEARQGVWSPVSNALVLDALAAFRAEEAEHGWAADADAAYRWFRLAAADTLRARFCADVLGKFFDKVSVSVYFSFSVASVCRLLTLSFHPGLFLSFFRRRGTTSLSVCGICSRLTVISAHYTQFVEMSFGCRSL